MQRLLFYTAALAVVFASDEAVNPIRRIVTLLQKMQVKTREEGEREKNLMVKFQCFCTGNSEKMTKEVAETAQEIKRLAAVIEENAAKKAQLDGDLVEHKQDRAEAKAAIEKATSIREKEKSDYDATVGDQQANIDAMSKAIKVLSKNLPKASFIQAESTAVARIRKLALIDSGISSYEKQSLLEFFSASSAPDYQAASGEIVGILKTMLDKVNEDFSGVVEAEKSSVKSFNELVKAKQEEIAANSAAIESKTQRTGELAVQVVEAKNNKENLERDVGESQAFLANLQNECATKETEYNERVKTRNEELQAIGEAIKMLNDDDALDLFKKTLPTPAAKMFLQISRRRSVAAKAFSFLHLVSNRNPTMSLIEAMLRKGGVGFGKVIKMIDEMMVVMDKEQSDDDSKKVYCEDELDSSADSKKETSGKIDDLSAQISEGEEVIKVLKADIDKLKEEQEDLSRAMRDSVEQRDDDHKEYVESTADLNAAVQLLHKVKNRLNKFYNPAAYKPPAQRELTDEERIAQNMGETIPAEAPQLIQIKSHTFQPEMPETFSGPYKKSSSSGGVTALMDMMIKDVETQISEAKHEEETGARDHERFMAESKKSIGAKMRTQTEKESQLANTEANTQTAKTDRRNNGIELQNINEMISKLHGECDFLIQNYDFRKEARAQEKNSLRNAKAVLSGADYSFLQVEEAPAEVNYQKIEPFGKEDTAHELTKHAAKTQDTLVDAVENAEVAEIKRTVFRSLTRLRAATIKEFDTIARLETQAIDAYNDAHHYRAENPLSHLHEDEAPVPTDKLKSFH